jgi:hypothetical protein
MSCLSYEFLIMQYLPVGIYSCLTFPYIFLSALLPDAEIYILSHSKAPSFAIIYVTGKFIVLFILQCFGVW